MSQILQLRYDVFVKEQSVPLSLEIDGKDDLAIHLAAISNRKLLQLYPPLCSSRLSMVILGQNELRIYGERFLCHLFHTAQGIVDRRFNRYDTFIGTGIGAIEDVHQVTDEIVQYLRNHDLIRTVEDSEDITLSMAGLAEAERVCK
jgi:hypothetical protein